MLVCSMVLLAIVLPTLSLFCRVSSLFLIIISLLFTLCSHVDKAEWMWLHTPARALWSAYSGLGRAPWAGSCCGWLPTQRHCGLVVALAGSLDTAVFTHRLLVGLLCNCCMEHHRNRLYQLYRKQYVELNWIHSGEGFGGFQGKQSFFSHSCSSVTFELVGYFQLNLAKGHQP